MTSEFYEEGEFEGLPADPKKRELIKGYVTEALQYRQEKDLADKREKDVYASCLLYTSDAADDAPRV